MPFEQCFPRALTPASVRAYAPAASGMYGISSAREWIYISETASIQSALLLHLDDRNTALMKSQPTGFVYEVCNPESWQSRKNRLILEYGPRFNRA